MHVRPRRTRERLASCTPAAGAMKERPHGPRRGAIVGGLMCSRRSPRICGRSDAGEPERSYQLTTSAFSGAEQSQPLLSLVAPGLVPRLSGSSFDTASESLLGFVHPIVVMRVLVTRIHVFFGGQNNTWMTGTSPRLSGSRFDTAPAGLFSLSFSPLSSWPCLSRPSTCSWR